MIVGIDALCQTPLALKYPSRFSRRSGRASAAPAGGVPPQRLGMRRKRGPRAGQANARPQPARSGSHHPNTPPDRTPTPARPTRTSHATHHDQHTAGAPTEDASRPAGTSTPGTTDATRPDDPAREATTTTHARTTPRNERSRRTRTPPREKQHRPDQTAAGRSLAPRRARRPSIRSNSSPRWPWLWL